MFVFASYLQGWPACGPRARAGVLMCRKCSARGRPRKTRARARVARVIFQTLKYAGARAGKSYILSQILENAGARAGKLYILSQTLENAGTRAIK